MRGSTARFLRWAARETALVSGQPRAKGPLYRAFKRRWKETPRPERAALRRRVERRVMAQQPWQERHDEVDPNLLQVLADPGEIPR